MSKALTTDELIKKMAWHVSREVKHYATDFEIDRAQEAAPAEEDHDGITYREDPEQMRVQLIFAGKPAEDVRAILKKWAFRWSPRNQAWQRQLTENGKHAARRAMQEIAALKA